MYPMLLKPILKDYLWGGRRLIDDFGYETSESKAAEAWLLSCRQEGNSIIKNGIYSGLTLSEVIEREGRQILGKKAQAFPYFPLLIKLIDAKDRPSVQVHPDNEYALSHEGDYGKTEMWYIVDCEEGAKLLYGLNKNTTREELERRIKGGTLSQICNYVNIKKGDVFFIPAGTVHAIGKGILIAEIQQNSNVTYRVSDYGRLGSDGKPRPLHIAKALDVITLKATEKAEPSEDLTIYSFGLSKTLASCEYFTSELLSLDGKAGMLEADSFISVIVLEGEAVLCHAGGTMSIKKGDSIFIPANTRITISGRAEIICSHL